MVKRISVSRVAIYARISVATEESVSVERQLKACQQYAASRGWTVVLEEVDSGVSATHNRPEQRKGWRKILNAAERYDAVIIWKLDRLARSVLDFMHADQALTERGAAVVAVEDSVDMTTPQGRALAQLLAVFAELEAATISARVSAARRALLGMGRWPGSSVPFGYRNVPNPDPDGKGVVLEQDPTAAPILAEMVSRVISGASVHSVARWLDSTIPPRRAKRWDVSTVEALLRNPILVGMIPYTPGRKAGKRYAGDVFRDADGVPVINPSLAVITQEERALLLSKLDSAKRPGSRAARSDVRPSLLSGVIVCGSCQRPLHRVSGPRGYLYYRCQRVDCDKPIGVNRPDADELIRNAIVDNLGHRPEFRVETDTGNPEVTRLEVALDAKWEAVRDAHGAERLKLITEIEAAEVALEAARNDSGFRGPRLVETGRTLGEAWLAAEDDAERNSILVAGGVVIELSQGKYADPERFEIIFPAPAIEDDGETVRFGVQVRQ